jgi:hypothetical protein
MIKEDEIVCPKCGYKNRTFRSNCKNCGEVLFAWAQVQAAKRKMPLKQFPDILLATTTGLFLLAVPIIVSELLNSIEKRAFLSVLGLIGLLIGIFYAGIVWFLLPLYYLFVYLRGNETTTGTVEQSKYTNNPDSDNPDYYVVIKFVPEHAQDPRPRVLTCKVFASWSMEKNQILISYGLRNPDIVLIEGEL